VYTAAHGLGAGSLTPRLTRLFAGKVPTWAASRPRAGVILLRRLVGQPACYSHIAMTRDTFVATPPHVTAACYACFADMDLRSPLTAVDLPSLVMVGTLDRLTPTGLGRALAASLPRARLDVLDDAGHMLPLEAPGQVATAITSLTA
jgi:pimeloyl-ACP methyl ester carboxylesterase